MKKVLRLIAATALTACAYQPVVDLGDASDPGYREPEKRYEADLAGCRALAIERQRKEWERVTGFSADWPTSHVNNEKFQVIVIQRCLASKVWEVEDWAD